MSNIDNGGPAFPHVKRPRPDLGNGITEIWTDDGMTLRDWFAGQALTIVYMRFETSADPCPSDLAMQAYFIADAMIEARKVQP
jgi:hypothetical protein